MGKKYRTPDGDEYDPDELETGKACVRCDGFIPVRSSDDLPARKSDVSRGDYAALSLKEMVDADDFVLDSFNGVLCPDCHENLKSFLFTYEG